MCEKQYIELEHTACMGAHKGPEDLPELGWPGTQCLDFGLTITTKIIAFLKQSKTVSPFFIGSLQRSKVGERDLLSGKEDEIATPQEKSKKNNSSI